MSEASLTYRLQFRVRSYEVEPNGHATELTLQNYLQEAAASHAHQLYFSIQRLFPMGLTWLLVKSRLAVERYPLWQEVIEVETWPAGWQGAIAWRDFIFRNESGEVLARGTSHWMLFDFRRKRPALIENRFPRLPGLDKQAIDRNIPTIPKPERVYYEKTIPTTWLNMDMNNHANNAAYVAWAMLPVLASFRTEWVVGAMDINFLKEVFSDVELQSRVQHGGEGDTPVTLHEIVNPDGQPVMRAQCTWRPRKENETYTIIREEAHGT